jgi:Ser/Thr protein kinase RdoA (MazF antagonist)
MDKAEGVSLTDILLDKTDIGVYLCIECENLGVAIGRFLKNFHLSRTFPTDEKSLENHPMYLKLINKRISNAQSKSNVEEFIKNPETLRLIHGDLSPHNIFIDVIKTEQNGKTEQTEYKITLIDLDRFVQNSKIGGFASYEYFQFMSSVDWVSHKVLNNSALKRGFIAGYGDFNEPSNSITQTVCSNYWTGRL